jgi:predicted nucleic acid-binding protein
MHAYFLPSSMARKIGVPDIAALLAEGDRREREIVTSTLTVTEVAFATQEKRAGALDPAVERRIDALWRPPSPVRLADFHVGIAEEARRLMREAIRHGWRRLKPGDAIHLATAVDLAADVLHTYNVDDFARWGPLLGMLIGPPEATQPELHQ